MNKKIICFFSFLIATISVATALDGTQNKIIMDTINFNKKLMNCAVAENGTMGIKIYGIEQGLCHFKTTNAGASITDLKTGKSISISSCDYKVPLAFVKRYAQGIIKITEEMYGLNNTKISETEKKQIEKTMSEYTSYSEKFCK